MTDNHLHPPSRRVSQFGDIHDTEQENVVASNELLSRDQIAAEYGLSKRWLEVAAIKGNGPPMVRLSWRMIRYRRSDFEDWLNSRTVNSSVQVVEG